jgi:hypothetical protein
MTVLHRFRKQNEQKALTKDDPLPKFTRAESTTGGQGRRHKKKRKLKGYVRFTCVAPCRT